MSQQSIFKGPPDTSHSNLGQAGTDNQSLHSKGSDSSDTSRYYGNFKHLKEKSTSVYYEEAILRPDPYFHVDIGAQFDSYFRGQKVRFKEKRAEHFASIVDLDAYEYHKVVFHSFLNEILQSASFRGLILFLVLLNAVMIGMQTFPTITDSPTILRCFVIIDQVVLSIFIFEIFIKWLYDFRLFWKVPWNILDFTIILLIVVSSTVMPIGAKGNSRALVTVRVVRAFRSLRSISSMASLSIVSHTIVKSGKNMGNIILVLIVFMLVMSVMGVILFDIEEINVSNFINGLDAWYTVFICVTQDGWADLLEEFLRFGSDSDHHYDKLLVIYLLIAVSAGGFVFANLIVAVIVTNLEVAVKEFREEKAMSENPLEFYSDQLSSEVDVVPVHDLLAQNNIALLSQRPFKLPNLKNISLRRIQSYIAVIVALEHNMLEAEIIHMDLEKVLAVIVSTMSQLDVFKSQHQLETEKAEALQEFSKFAAAAGPNITADTLTQIETLTQLQKLKYGGGMD